MYVITLRESASGLVTVNLCTCQPTCVYCICIYVTNLFPALCILFYLKTIYVLIFSKKLFYFILFVWQQIRLIQSQIADYTSRRLECHSGRIFEHSHGSRVHSPLVGWRSKSGQTQSLRRWVGRPGHGPTCKIVILLKSNRTLS